MTKFEKFPANSKVWIYQSTAAFNEEDAAVIRQKIDEFAAQWESHSLQLKAAGELLHNRFIVFSVDEGQAGASGCSIDKSVKFIQSIEKQYGVDMFNRMNFAYEKDGLVNSAGKEEFSKLYGMGIINDETLVFNNLVEDLGEFRSSWKVPLGKSWHKNLLSWDALQTA